jgi:hypothetical protein
LKKSRYEFHEYKVVIPLPESMKYKIHAFRTVCFGDKGPIKQANTNKLASVPVSFTSMD